MYEERQQLIRIRLLETENGLFESIKCNCTYDYMYLILNVNQTKDKQGTENIEY